MPSQNRVSLSKGVYWCWSHGSFAGFLLFIPGCLANVLRSDEGEDSVASTTPKLRPSRARVAASAGGCFPLSICFRWNGKQKNHFKRGPPWKFPLDESMRLSLTCSIWMHLAGTHSFWKSLRAAVMFGIVRWPCVPCKEDPNFPMWVTISKGMDQAWSCRFWLPNCSGDWTGNGVENIHVPRIRAVKYIHTHTHTCGQITTPLP